MLLQLPRVGGREASNNKKLKAAARLNKFCSFPRSRAGEEATRATPHTPQTCPTFAACIPIAGAGSQDRQASYKDTLDATNKASGPSFRSLGLACLLRDRGLAAGQALCCLLTIGGTHRRTPSETRGHTDRHLQTGGETEKLTQHMTRKAQLNPKHHLCQCLRLLVPCSSMLSVPLHI